MTTPEASEPAPSSRDPRAAFEFYYERERFELALIEAERMIAAEPDSADARALHGLTLARLGREQESRESMRKAVGTDPESYMALAMLAMSALRAGKIGEAEGAAQEALRVAPQESSAHRLMARILAEKSDWKGALAAVDRAVALDPHDENAMELRVQLLEKMGRRAEAKHQLEQALQTAPDDASLHSTRGWQALWSNDFDTAAVAFSDALRIDPTDASARSGMKSALKGRSPFYRLMVRIVSWFADRGIAGQAFFILAPLAILFLTPRIEPYLPHVNTTNGFYLPIGLVFAFFLSYLRQFTELNLAFDPVGRTLVTRVSLIGACLTVFLLIAGVAGYAGGSFSSMAVEFGSASLMLATVSTLGCHFDRRWQTVIIAATIVMFLVQPMLLLGLAMLGLIRAPTSFFEFVLLNWTHLPWIVLFFAMLGIVLRQDRGEAEADDIF